MFLSETHTIADIVSANQYEHVYTYQQFAVFNQTLQHQVKHQTQKHRNGKTENTPH